MDNINIVISFDKNYFRQAINYINSLLDFTEETTRYNLYCLIDDDVTEKIKKIFLDSTNDKYITKIIFLNANNYFNKLYISRHITRATYFRLFLHRLISVDKIIYFDVDMIFKKSIKDIYDIDIEDYFIAAVNDPYINFIDTWSNLKKNYKYWTQYFNDDYRGKYFNAGFLLLNLDRIRKLNIDNYILGLCSQSFEYHDQDILNILAINKFKKIMYLNFCNNVFSIDTSKYYDQASFENIYLKKNKDSITNHSVIIHYVGEKPWNNPKIPMANLWWKQAKETPYYGYFLNKLLFRNRPIFINKVLDFICYIDKNDDRIKIRLFGLTFRLKRRFFNLK